MAKIYCSNCGQLISTDSNFCRYCGAAQHGEESAVYSAQAAPLRHPTVPSPEVLHTQNDQAAVRMQRETVPRRLLSPGAIWLFFINYNLRMVILIPLLAIGTYYEPLVAGVFAVYETILFLIALLAYNNFHFSIDEHTFKKEYGIIHKRAVTVPFRQIQNVNIVRTLIDQILGIAKLEIESAGSSSIKRREVIGGIRSKAEGILPGLTLKDARHLHDLLLRKKEYEHRNGSYE